jgi:hypothetical protein
MSVKTWHEYYRDQNKVEVLIKYTFKLPALVKNFNIDHPPIHVRQTDGEIHVNYHKVITQSLLEDLIAFWTLSTTNKIVPQELLQKNPGQYIVGFIAETLPKINEEILIRKYREGHVLLRTISQFDIYNVFIVDKKAKYVGITWPLLIPNFTEIKKVPEGFDIVFLRDFIDAMTEYFYFNLDECVKKVVTSLENYFTYYKLKPADSTNVIFKIFYKKKSKFKKLINEYVTEPFYGIKERDLKILRENILYIYNLRNLIVHDKFRLKPENFIIAKKAIKTLLYVYQSKFVHDDKKHDYILALYHEFGLIAEMMIGHNLDNYAKAEQKKSSPAHNEDEFNEWIFSNLKIKKYEKKLAKPGY